jgi:hypothetical protein
MTSQRLNVKLSSQALKLTRLSGWLLGGPDFGEDRAMQRPCPLSAVQLSGGIRRQVTMLLYH